MSGSSSAGQTFSLRGTNVKKITLPRQQAWPEPGGGRAVGHGHGFARGHGRGEQGH